MKKGRCQGTEFCPGTAGMEMQILSRCSVHALHRMGAQCIYSSKSDMVFKEDHAGDDIQVDCLSMAD